MEFLPERLSSQLVSPAQAIEVVDLAFRSLSSGTATLFPVVLCIVDEVGSRFGVKSGHIADGRLMGPKIGAYWPGNLKRGTPNHSSTVILLDPDTGLPAAFVGASHLTALRTAAADAVAVRALTSPDANRVGVIGAGHQALHDVRAIAVVRGVEAVFVWSRNEARADEMVAQLKREGFNARTADRRTVAGEAQILVTATSSREALVEADWVRPGAHISAMGADGPGKQELDPALVEAATLFADEPTQSVEIGEFQTAHRQGRLEVARVRRLGDVLTGRATGRTSAEEITIFDSSGTAIQDLAIAAMALDHARAAGTVIDVS